MAGKDKLKDEEWVGDEREKRENVNQPRFDQPRSAGSDFTPRMVVDQRSSSLTQPGRQENEASASSIQNPSGRRIETFGPPPPNHTPPTRPRTGLEGPPMGHRPVVPTSSRDSRGRSDTSGLPPRIPPPRSIPTI